jgi:hypothetical protein
VKGFHIHLSPLSPKFHHRLVQGSRHHGACHTPVFWKCPVNKDIIQLSAQLMVTAKDSYEPFLIGTWLN